VHQSILVRKCMTLLASLILLTLSVSLTALIAFHSNQQVHAAGTLESAFQQAVQEFNVQVAKLPTGCSNDGKTDYPGAIDCILNPTQHDCDLVPGTNAPCNYFSSSHFGPICRQDGSTITHIVIHDIEGRGVSAINAFENPKSNVSAHYVVDSDGTVYQVVHEKDIAFHAGHLWFNLHSIGIEHAGFDATGFQWYNAAEYLASAKLVAYLLNKYHMPLDHNHIVSHGTIPAAILANTPNHVDPGPYWLWDYYLKLIGIHQKQAAPPKVALSANSHIITLHPATDLAPFNRDGTETPANFNFFYLYNGPSTKSGLIPQEGTRSDITDETDNVEPDISYYYVNKVKDSARTGDTLYEIWYGESDQAHARTRSFFTHAKLAWLAVPRATAFQGKGTVVKLKGGKPIQISGKPATNTATTDYHIGDAPNGSVFISGYKVVEDGTKNIWYSINYNHRQAWVPASNVVEIL
jgi:N-acetyl-anhydromuramyl-L-alanine amidase AmpD